MWTAEYLLYFLMVRSLLQVKAYGRDFPSKFRFIFLVSMRGQLQASSHKHHSIRDHPQTKKQIKRVNLSFHRKMFFWKPTLIKRIKIS